MFLSLPHFLDADPWYTTLVSGLQPHDIYHRTFIDIEPVTGAAFNAQKQIQVAARMEHVPYVRKTKQVPLTYLPIFYVNQSGGK